MILVDIQITGCETIARQYKKERSNTRFKVCAILKPEFFNSLCLSALRDALRDTQIFLLNELVSRIHWLS